LWHDLASDQQGAGQSGDLKIFIYFNILQGMSLSGVGAAGAPFLPGGKICRLAGAKHRLA
jgi:hypothetical protein